MTEPTPLHQPKSEILEYFEYLAEWIDGESEEGLTEELIGWLEDHDAVRKSEVEPYGEIDEFYIPGGGGIIHFTHAWVCKRDLEPWERSYTLKLYIAAREHNPRPPASILHLL